MYVQLALGLVAISAYSFQVYLKDIIWLSFGIGKTIEPLSNFDYTCRALRHDRLSGCEDMWFSESTRQLFLTCGDAPAKAHWMPSMGALDHEKRSRKDALVVMDIDSPPRRDGTFPHRALRTPGFEGTAGDGLLQLNGFNVEPDGKGGARVLLVNNGPSIDPTTGEILDKQASGGHNGTIEEFAIDDMKKANEMRHVRTFASPLIATPNRPAGTGDGGFYVTNDHGLNGPGLKRELAMVTGDGIITYCHPSTGCKIAATGLSYPNGLARDPSTGLVYVPSSTSGYVRVYLPRDDGSHILELVEEIRIPYGIDNLTIAPGGEEIYAAAFPASSGIPRMNADRTHSPATTVLRLYKKEGGGWAHEKVVEDVNSEVLPAATTALKDGKTGRLFISGVISPFITVCDPK